MADEILRVLLTKSFIDSHDRAIKTIALALRDAGMEVMLIDYERPEDVVRMAVDEDVDLIGISFMSGGQVQVTQEVMRLLAEAGRESVPVVVGGTIRPFDVEELERSGVRGIFGGGESLEAIVTKVRTMARERQMALDE